MKEWKVIFATLVIFGTGVITGGLLVHLTTASPKNVRKQVQTAQQFPGTPPVGPKELRGNIHEQRQDYIRRLQQLLALEGEQTEKIERLVRESQARAKSVWDSVAPKIVEEHGKVRSQIRDVLTEEQRRKFDEMNMPLPTLPKSKEGRGPKKPVKGTNNPAQTNPFRPPVDTNSVPAIPLQQ